MDPTGPELKLDFARRLADALADQSSTEIPPETSLADLDALAGFGGAIGDDLRFSVYVLDAWDAGRTTRPGFGRAPDHPAARPRWRSTASC